MTIEENCFTSTLFPNSREEIFVYFFEFGIRIYVFFRQGQGSTVDATHTWVLCGMEGGGGQAKSCPSSSCFLASSFEKEPERFFST